MYINKNVIIHFKLNSHQAYENVSNFNMLYIRKTLKIKYAC